MRLLYFDGAGKLRLTDDIRKDVPPYAILSHRWGTDQDEVNYLDITNSVRSKKLGWAKLRFCGEQARKDGLNHFWVDTCCINKGDARELSRAITSMFRWYASSQQCYVYLADVTAHGLNRKDKLPVPKTRPWETAFRRSSWFTRGWTLQELLAPAKVSFYSYEGQYLGNRNDLGDIISAVTLIDSQALTGKPLHEFSDAERFRWAINRHTTEPEDQAYCLLGIFGVTMPPHYGEGEDSAYDRLKEEIIRQRRNELIKLDVKQRQHGEADMDEEYRDPDIDPVENMDTPSIMSNLSSPIGRNDAGSFATSGMTSTRSASTFMTATSHQSLARSLGVTDVPGSAALHVRRRAIMQFLRFDSMDTRRSTIKLPLDSTCHWLLTHEAYNNWIEPEQPEQSFLWIKGHPGAGKSTLMKFLEYRLAETIAGSSKTVISFYFNARGEPLERSVSGAYRSLISQLLEAVPDLDEVLDHLRFGRPQPPDSHVFENAPIALLQELFAGVVSRLGNRQVYCLIDALDETDEDDVVDMVEYLQSQRHGTKISICFASRHYPTLDIPTTLQIKMDHDAGHRDDIRRYVDTYLRIGTGSVLDQVKVDLQSKANGVFMWVVLVVGMLNKEARRGNIEAVRNQLKRLPPQLNELFNDIVRNGDIMMRDFSLCLQWILYAARPLRLEEFYFAMASGRSGSAPLTSLVWNKADITRAHMEDFVITHSKGLAELTGSTPRVVQFIHESVREFLLGPDGLASICEGGAVPISALAHERLKCCCYLGFASGLSLVAWRQRRRLVTQVSTVAERHSLSDEDKMPFTHYAVEHLLFHAEHAASYISQQGFLVDLGRDKYRDLIGMCEYIPSLEALWATTLLTLLTELGYLTLMQTLLEADPEGAFWEAARGQFALHDPLTIALARGNRDAIELLLYHGVPTMFLSDIRSLLGSRSELQDLLDTIDTVTSGKVAQVYLRRISKLQGVVHDRTLQDAVWAIYIFERHDRNSSKMQGLLDMMDTAGVTTGGPARRDLPTDSETQEVHNSDKTREILSAIGEFREVHNSDKVLHGAVAATGYVERHLRNSGKTRDLRDLMDAAGVTTGGPARRHLPTISEDNTLGDAVTTSEHAERHLWSRSELQDLLDAATASELAGQLPNCRQDLLDRRYSGSDSELQHLLEAIDIVTAVEPTRGYGERVRFLVSETARSQRAALPGLSGEDIIPTAPDHPIFEGRP